MILTNFLIFCSGADKGMISQCPKSEANKYASIGATVLLTGFLAAISSGYALYTIFRGEEYAMMAALGFGLVWATVIFNLDRYIVSSLRKEGNWKKELLYATPRFIIAILISLVIAKPLEVRIFASRIEQQILEDKRQKLEDEKLSIDKLNDLTKLENTMQGQTSELGTLDSLRQGDPTSDDFKKILGDRNIALQDLNSVSKSNNPKISDYNFKISQIKGDPNNYRVIKNDSTGEVIDRKLLSEANKSIGDLSYSRNVLLNEIKAKQKRVENLDAEIQKLRNDYKAIMAQRINEKEAEMAQTKQTKAQADSIAKNQFDESVKVKERSYTNNFITQVEALGNLNAKTFSTMWWTSILLMFLFITIETAPIVVKLLSKRGPYDELLERVEYEHYLEQQKIISDRNDEINNLLVEIQAMNKLKGEVRMKTEKSKLDAELKANTALLDEIAIRQADLAKLAIDKWYYDELSNFKSNPNNQYAQTKQQVKPPSIEDKLWKADNLQGEIFYLFKNGQPTNNELVYMEGGKTEKGSWEYLKANREIRVNILNNTETYTIEDLTETSAKLKTLTNDYLELTKSLKLWAGDLENHLGLDPFGQPFHKEELERALVFSVSVSEKLQTVESIGVLVFVGQVCITSNILSNGQNHKSSFSSSLFLCLLQMPYGFYQAVRFAGLIGFAILAYQANEKENKTEMIIFICLAVLFQPLLKISLGRQVWNVVDVIVGIGLLLSIFMKPKESPRL